MCGGGPVRTMSLLLLKDMGEKTERYVTEESGRGLDCLDEERKERQKKGGRS